jgi:hypothetical protein
MLEENAGCRPRLSPCLAFGKALWRRHGDSRGRTCCESFHHQLLPPRTGRGRNLLRPRRHLDLHAAVFADTVVGSDFRCRGACLPAERRAVCRHRMHAVSAPSRAAVVSSRGRCQCCRGGLFDAGAARRGRFRAGPCGSGDFAGGRRRGDTCNCIHDHKKSLERNGADRDLREFEKFSDVALPDLTRMSGEVKWQASLWRRVRDLGQFEKFSDVALPDLTPMWTPMWESQLVA